MPALFLTEEDVESLLTMEEAIDAVEAALREHGEGRAIVQARRRVPMGERGYYHYMAAGVPGLNVFGQKAYTVYGGGDGAYGGTISFLVHLFDGTTGRPLAIIEADRLGWLRTGATSAVAARYMARPDTTTVGIFGAGFQARGQLEGLVAVLPAVREVKASAPDPQRLARFCDEMSERLKRTVRPATPEETVRGSQVIVTATSSATPVFDGAWLGPGTHMNAIGSNYLTKRELDPSAVLRADLVVVDHKEQAQLESGDLLQPIQDGRLYWEAVRELGDVVAGHIQGRPRPEAITLFKSHGLALEDIAVGRRVVDLALQSGRGLPLPF